MLQDSLQNALTPAGTALVAQKGNLSTLFNAKRSNPQSWIVDSGSSNHMTGDITVFSQYFPCRNNNTMRITDGTLSKVVSIGSVTISENITLKLVLYVPNLDCKLLSISKITKDLKCVAKFFPNACVFQVLDSERIIGSTKLCAGLYLFKVEVSENKSSKVPLLHLV